MSARFGYWRTFAICVALALSACTAAQMQLAQSDIAAGIQAACTDVMAAHNANPTSAVASYAVASCGNTSAMAALVQNSATVQWLGSLAAQLAAPASCAGSARDEGVTRAAIIAAALMLGGCAGAEIWIPVIAGSLGVAAGAEQIIAGKETPPPDHPPLDGTWTPP